MYGDFLRPDHRRMHKWFQYFEAYEAHFARFRNRHVTLFEIGIGEGGSLEQWRGYLGPFATIVGMDVYPRTRQLEDRQIHVRIGSQADPGFLRSVLDEFGPPDIVIDDGSHLQHHVNATFDLLYPHVAKNGVYLVEDLHAAYWPNHGGGLGRPGSFIETAKGMVDRMHAFYVDAGEGRTRDGDRTRSIHFYDSVAVFEVGEFRAPGHRTTGDAARFDNEWAPEGWTRDAYAAHMPELMKDLEVEGPHLESGAPPASGIEAARLRALEEEVAVLRGSTSWRLTAPLRGLGRLLGRRGP